MRIAMLAKALILILLPGALLAEPVQIRAGFGERGQGWLFGSPRDGRCWLALPLHVIAPDGAQEPAAFVFDDTLGRSGQSDRPIPVGAVPGAVEAAAGATDLAFAPVGSGARLKDACNSRLGLAEGLFRITLPQAGAFVIRTVQDATTASFPAELKRMVNGEDQGAVMLLAPRDQADLRYLKGGISGAVATMDHQGQEVPAAMVLQVLPDSDTMRALRFDRIAAAFALVEAHLRGQAPQAPQAEVAHQVEAILGRLEPGAPPLARLSSGQGGCWRIAAAPGERRVDIVISIPEGQRIETLRASVTEDCGPPSAALLEMRWPGGGWRTLSTQCPISADGAASCAVRRSGPMDLRLRLDPGEGGVAIGAIALE
ncbi:hypothetical protein SAMN04487972_11935 [Paracoccus halophilus]|uniref:Uncharacterized protein n=1 Tax=Paracoccus halophilus TaxID=376733 RepID=A0A099EZI6_9RHOB|nr:hypothetical protein [Paracoccus halophilus]KGJ03619.1 hypothetical protein IT41_13475 [Paracoccus halophilus]SFA58027.1 hypothetical protein SAMN04487972_11935 [Paracoccus halophilus]